jgi:predicted amidophosphoribosyltransferase
VASDLKCPECGNALAYCYCIPSAADYDNSPASYFATDEYADQVSEWAEVARDYRRTA